MRVIRLQASDVKGKRADQLAAVAYWLVEIDDGGKPLREIEYGLGDTPLDRAPNASSRGLITDSPVTFGMDWPTACPVDVFERLWEGAQSLSRDGARASGLTRRSSGPLRGR